jgi:hypothetical protein
MEYLNYLGSMIINDAKCTYEIKSRIAMAKTAFNKEMALSNSKFDLNLRKKLVNCYSWSIALIDGETWTLQKVHHNYPESFEMWHWKRMVKISGTNSARNEALQRFKVERNILQTIKE